MAPRLLNRQKQIPNPPGLCFYIPAIKWRSGNNASFQNIVDSAIAALHANPAASQKLGWDLSPAAMADRVDEFNAAICASHGWTGYIGQEASFSLPKATPHEQTLLLSKLRNVAAEAKNLIRGAKTAIEFLDSGEPAVDTALVESRAAVCVVCPKNDKSPLTDWFAVPAAELIRKNIERAQARGLKTTLDDNLGTCTACLCPMRTKIWFPIDWITKRQTPDQVAKLKQAPGCWIVSEGKL